jgi:hypothetical protein
MRTLEDIWRSCPLLWSIFTSCMWTALHLRLDIDLVDDFSSLEDDFIMI